MQHQRFTRPKNAELCSKETIEELNKEFGLNPKERRITKVWVEVERIDSEDPTLEIKREEKK